MIATTRFETPHARRYLGQICKHFAHKIEVEHTATEGRCALPSGPAEMVADDSGLWVRIKAADAEGLARGKHIVEGHLLRFAYREAPEALTWTEAETAR